MGRDAASGSPRRWLACALVALAASVAIVIGPAAAAAFPVTSISGVPAGWSPTPVTVVLAADPPEAAETFYRLGDGLAVPYAGPFTISAEGTTAITYWSRDGHSAMEIPGTAVVRVDTHPPRCAISGLDGGWLAPGLVTFRLDATDELSGVASVWYRVCGGPTLAYNGPVTLDARRSGWLEYWAVDAAGNCGVHATIPLRVLDGAPLTWPTGVPGGWSAAPVTVTLDATSALSPIACTYVSVGGGVATLYESPITVGREGVTTVSFRSVDANGTEEATRSIDVTIDRTAPVSQAGGAPSGIASGPVLITLTATDGGSGVAAVRYSIDGDTPCTSTGVVRLLGSVGPTQLEWWAVDAAGNEEAHHDLSVRFDTVAPVTVCDALGSYVGTAALTLMPSDGVAGSGVAATYFRVDGAPAAEGRAMSVTGTGAHAVQYWSVDAVGNVEQPHWLTFAIDAPPSGTTTPPGSTPTTSVVTPTPSVATVIGAPRVPTSARHGRSFTVTGSTRPRWKSGTALRIACYRLVRGHWRYAASVRASVRAARGGSTYSARIRLSRTGRWRMRAYATVGGKRVHSAYRSMRIR